MANKEFICKEYLEAFPFYRGLNAPVRTGNMFVIDGIIDVFGVDGYFWESFEIRIVIPENFPNNLPILYETSNKIPRSKQWDWHVGEDGECCVGTPAQQFRLLYGQMTLLNWINKFTVPFLANFIHRRDNSNYANGEFSHGIKGLLEDYENLFNANGKDKVIEQLQYILGMPHTKNKKCFCKSGKLYKRCYLLNKENHLLGIPKGLLLQDLKKIKGY